MKTYAVYRVLYGEDFIVESVKSILTYVDKIFIVWDDIPWGNVHTCKYKDWDIHLLDRQYDRALDRLADAFPHEKKLIYIYDHKEDNTNQFTQIINEKILPHYEKPDLFIIPEVDHVMRKDQIEGAINHIITNDIQNATTIPIELWRSYKYRIPERARMATMFWNMKHIDKLDWTGRQANSKGMQVIPFYTHNFGFCFNPVTMFWKHTTAMAFSAKIGDDLPDELWFERWLTWRPDYNNKDLEISAGYQHYISHAFEYDVTQLPEIIKEKYGL